MNRHLALACAALLATSAAAQNQTLVFTGRFDFTGLEAGIEPGGSINDIKEFAITGFTPGVDTTARTWYPATTHHAFMGDAYGDGNYSRLNGIKTTFERWNFAGPFVKHSDKSAGDPRLAFWTVRDNGVGKNFTVLTGNGSGTRVIQPGDFFRWLPNGDIELFMTQALWVKAQGPQTGSWADGASAMCQDAQGNLYYSPAEGGHWVSGNQTGGPIFCNDGSICMIEQQNITYDANGNVQDVAADSALLLFEEVGVGTAGGPSVRDMVANAGANDTSGVQVTTTANMVGLELDPNGGTIISSYEIGVAPNQVYPTVPNLLFTFDNGTWAATIFSSADAGLGHGSLAVINGVKCGEDSPGVAATGSWTGTQQVGFSPTTMGIALVDEPADTPLIADAPGYGTVTSGTASLDLDTYGNPFTPVFWVYTVPISGPSMFAPSVPLSSLGLGPIVDPGSFGEVFAWPMPTSLGLVVSDANGYSHRSSANPWSSVLVGVAAELQAVALIATGGRAQIKTSNPVQLHFN